MPPKAKFKKEEIVSAALNIARTDGIDCVTARSVGEKLGSSARPIFTVFQSMDEVIQSVIKAAKMHYDRYIQVGLSATPAFKGVGMAYIRFAKEEPQLFRLLFMTDQASPDLDSVLPLIDNNYTAILASVESCYQLSRENAYRLYQHLWIYTHGIAALCATHVCHFSDEETGKLLTEVCTGILQKIKTGEAK